MRTPRNMCWGGSCVLGLLLLWGCAANEPVGSNTSVATSVRPQNPDWERLVDDCISRVNESDAVFYRRGDQLNGSQVAREMRQYLRHILRAKNIPDPFGRNAGVTLAAITTHEGIYMDGLTGTPEPILIEVGGRRVKLYDWLKREFGVATLPGEEPGHEVFETTRYETDITLELLAQWEQYIDKCIQAVREAKAVTFSIKEEVWAAAEVATMLENNRANTIRMLKSPELRDHEEKRYSTAWVFVELTRVPAPTRAFFTDQAQYNKAVELWIMGLNLVRERGGTQTLTGWIESKVGEPPLMPKLRKKK